MRDYANAKINLTLKVFDKREDGYHSIESLMVPIFLHDVIDIKKTEQGITYHGPHIKDNLIIKTIEIFIDKYGIQGGVDVRLEKRIPIGAGLAGGSADAMAVLRLMNKVFETHISYKELVEIANTLGSDTAFCLLNKPAYCFGRGEIVKPLRFVLENKQLVVIKPRFSVSTADIYENYVYNKIVRDDKMIINLLEKNDFSNLDTLLYNDLEVTTRKLYPEVDKLFMELKSEGYNPHMSGSGPTLFVFIDNDEEGNHLVTKYRGEYFVFKTRIKN